MTARDPERTYRKLARLRAIDGFTLRPRPPQRIHDRYFDTPDGVLRKRGVALRLRTVDGKTSIGVKGPRRASSTRTEDRFERERTFSPAAISAIGSELRLSGDGGGPSDDPDARLEQALGVRQIQSRETLRLVREVTDARERRPVLAELVLDRVDFEIGKRVVRHYEIEVEAKRTGRGTDAARRVAGALLSRYPDELAEWPFGKLATGKGIEELLGDGGVRGLVRHGALTPRAYDVLASRISR